MKLVLVCAATALVVGGCASDWKIHGGPQECIQMCQAWNMDLVGMVGVGSQDRTGGGATACVCEIPTSGGAVGGVGAGASGMSASTGAVAVMLAESARQQQQRTQQNVRR